jgi:shikimate kinase
MSTIVLVGVPGAGKTTVGKLLAKNLGIDFFDSDQVIESRAGKSVSDIFNNVVLALGGGSLGNDETRAKVKDATTVWLVAGLAQAVDRVGMNRNRPLLLGNVRGQLADLMAAREPFYKEVAAIAVDTSKLIPSEVVTEIVSELGKIEAL